MDREDLGYTSAQWNAWSTLVDNPFILSWYLDTHHDPEQAACFTGQLTTDLDAAAATGHPAAGLLTSLASRADVTLTQDPVDPAGVTLEDAVATLLDATGDGGSVEVSLDEDLADALVPVVLAVADAVRARHTLDDVADAQGWGSDKLFNQSPGLVLDVGRAFPDVSDAEELAAFEDFYLADDGPRTLVDPARRILFAIEEADLGQFADASGELSFSTSAGTFFVGGAGDTTWEDGDSVLLLVDLGGDDTYTGTAGATRDGDNPVSVLVDVSGTDLYAYDEVPDANDTDGTLVSDEDGRGSAAGYYVSESDVSRQGAGRYGIGIAYDLGGGDDSYTSLRMSQGFGALGVGVLADDGGNDAYAAEAGAQGAGVFGWGLTYDGGGDDTWRIWADGQGFGYVGSGGLAYDAGGNDVWWSDPGNDFGGTTLYYSPQLASGQGNSSFTQGAGFGLRGDAYGVYLAGGIGVLRDQDGVDAYTSGVFAQGTGYWEGTGILADGAGDDTYDALWYIQGGAAHYALGILVDGAGNDQYNPNFTPYNVMLGSGHDLSMGIAIDESGDDTVHYTTLAAGASNCQGTGFWVDNDGSDTYVADSAYSTGLGNHSGECDESTGRTRYPSEALFMDAGGDADTYEWPKGDTRSPSDDSTFGIEWTGGSDEHGGAVDGDAETNFHVW